MIDNNCYNNLTVIGVVMQMRRCLGVYAKQAEGRRERVMWHAVREARESAARCDWGGFTEDRAVVCLPCMVNKDEGAHRRDEESDQYGANDHKNGDGQVLFYF